MRIILLSTSIFALLVSCSAWKDPSKYRLSDGKFTIKESHSRKTVYIKIVDEAIQVHPLDSDSTFKFLLEHETSRSKVENFKKVFFKKSFDVDFLTVPLKLRPPRNSMPGQLNTNINGNFFIGFREDRYKIKYKQTQIKSMKREVNHFGYSIGLFNGLGATAMNPWVTNDKIDIEYDGIVYLKGVALLLGIDNLNFGIALGVDHLLDANRKYWIYQGTPWLGLTLGLNLN